MKAARIVVLSVALAAGGVAALLAGRSEPPPKPQAVQPQQIASVDVLVAKSDIEMGKSISADDVAWQAWPLNANTGNFIRKSDHPNAVGELAGSVARAGFILPNDHVDIVLTKRDREAEKAAGIEVHTSETILADIRVLAIDQQLEKKNGQKVVVGKTATLELTPGQVEIVTLARQTGTLSLAL